MPDKTTKLSEITVNILYVFGGLWTFLGIIGGIILRYILLLLEVLKKDILHVKENSEKDFKEIKEEQKHLRDMHDDHYIFEKETKPEISELKNEVKNVVKDLDRLQDSHDNNHNVRVK